MYKLNLINFNLYCEIKTTKRTKGYNVTFRKRIRNSRLYKRTEEQKPQNRVNNSSRDDGIVEQVTMMIIVSWWYTKVCRYKALEALELWGDRDCPVCWCDYWWWRLVRRFVWREVAREGKDLKGRSSWFVPEIFPLQKQVDLAEVGPAVFVSLPAFAHQVVDFPRAPDRDR